MYPPKTYFKIGNYIGGCVCLIRVCIMFCFSMEKVDDGLLESYPPLECYHYFLESNKSSNELIILYNEFLFDLTNINQYYPFFILNCFSKNKNNCLVTKVHNVVNGLCLITIIGLSAAILIVFTIMSELRNLNGTLIVCYVLAVLIAHINELTVYYILNCENCSVEYIRNISFLNYFGYMHVLFWSNVNCFDVMLTYG